MKSKPVLPPTCVLLSLVVMLLLHFLLPLLQIIPLPWGLVGLIPLAAGIALNLLADRAFHQVDTTVKPFQESTALITTGVYRLSRHPMYLGFALILAGAAALLGSLTPWIMIPVFIILMEMAYIRVEESMLAQKFGPGWLAYKSKVRRWI